MKFGRTIKTSLYAEWADKYLQYSELKKEIKKRLAANNGVWTDKDEDEFVKVLSKELDKVYDFQKLKVRPDLLSSSKIGSYSSDSLMFRLQLFNRFQN